MTRKTTPASFTRPNLPCAVTGPFFWGMLNNAGSLSGGQEQLPRHQAGSHLGGVQGLAPKAYRNHASQKLHLEARRPIERNYGHCVQSRRSGPVVGRTDGGRHHGPALPAAMSFMRALHHRRRFGRAGLVPGMPGGIQAASVQLLRCLRRAVQNGSGVGAHLRRMPEKNVRFATGQ